MPDVQIQQHTETSLRVVFSNKRSVQSHFLHYLLHCWEELGIGRPKEMITEPSGVCISEFSLDPSKRACFCFLVVLL